LLQDAIWQPFIVGRALSVAAIVAGDDGPMHILPAAKQHLSEDGRFRYLGGYIPAVGVDSRALERIVTAACRAIPGLRGYLGMDLIVPDTAPDHPLVVEINPRLTSSYIGYRHLAAENLTARILDPQNSTPIRWGHDAVSFTPDGASN
jgi:predicted ATP-grasp superfamily ATP-dependent carboligase